MTLHISICIQAINKIFLCIKPLLHFHGFGPGLLWFETVVTPAKFGPGSTLSTVLLQCSYSASRKSMEDLRVRFGYAKELLRIRQGLSRFSEGCATAPPEESQVGNGCSMVCPGHVTVLVSELVTQDLHMRQCYGNAMDLLRIFYGYVADLSRSLTV